MESATDTVQETSTTHSTNLRDAAYIVALQRLLEAMKVRGW